VRHDQIAFGVADQVLHDPFDSGSLPVAEVGTRNAWRTARSWRWGRPRWRPHPPSGSPSDRPTPSSAPTEGLETLDQQTQGCRCLLVRGEARTETATTPTPAPLGSHRGDGRRKLRGEPASPAARAFDSSRLAEIRPALAHPLREQPIHVVVVVPTGGTLRDGVPGQVPQHDPLAACASCRTAPRHPDS
jgi:hypothetical protein